MFPRVSRVRRLQDYRLELSFADGTTGELDLPISVLVPGQNVASLTRFWRCQACRFHARPKRRRQHGIDRKLP